MNRFASRVRSLVGAALGAVAIIATRYRGLVDAYEPWNEPDGVGPLSKDQFALLTLAVASAQLQTQLVLARNRATSTRLDRQHEFATMPASPPAPRLATPPNHPVCGLRCRFR